MLNTRNILIIKIKIDLFIKYKLYEIQYVCSAIFKLTFNIICTIGVFKLIINAYLTGELLQNLRVYDTIQMWIKALLLSIFIGIIYYVLYLLISKGSKSKLMKNKFDNFAFTYLLVLFRKGKIDRSIFNYMLNSKNIYKDSNGKG